MSEVRKNSRVFYGWYIVAVCLLIILYTGGVAQFGFTAVFDSISNEFGWSYAQISLAASLRGFEMGLLAPVIGFLVDRIGPKRLIFGGGIVICLGFLLLSTINSIGMYYAAFGLIAIGMSTCSGTVLLTAVTHWFKKRANLATGMVVSGFALGGLMVPVVTKLIDTYDWRTAMMVLGIGTLVVVPPAALLVRHRPEKYGYLPDGEDEETGTAVDEENRPKPEAAPEKNVPVFKAIRYRAFWHVSLSSMCHSFVIGAVTIHIMPYLSTMGIPRSISALVALVIPIASITGRLGAGWAIPKLSNRIVYIGAFALLTSGLLIFGNINSSRIWMLVPFVLTFSLGWGFSVTTRISLQREYFGRASFGTIMGFVSGIMMVGNISGAPLAGLVYDIRGSYQLAWIAFAIMTSIGLILAITLPPFSSTESIAEEPLKAAEAVTQVS